MDTKRLILFVIFSFSILMLWENWQRTHAPQEQIQQTVDNSLPSSTNPADSSLSTPSVKDTDFHLSNDQRVNVETDLFNAVIDTTGGDLRRLELLKHRSADSNDKNMVLMDDQSSPMLYVAQTGLLGNDLPIHKSIFKASQTQYTLGDAQDKLDVVLTWISASGITVNKTYTFHRNSYVIDVTYQINNGSNTVLKPSAYYQIVHDGKSNQGTAMMPAFTGGAYYSEADKYKKIKFTEMAKSNLSKTSADGWVGLVQHYFVSAWILQNGVQREFYTKKINDDLFSIGSITQLSPIEAGAKGELVAKLYAGPQTQKYLNEAATGLEYTVDYGVLKVIAYPLFWVLSHIEKLVGNWGFAIILLTILLKVLFYPLSASSYRSMAQMRELAPRLQSLKEKFGDDKQKMQQAMMELYKTEKINPMGGCLPILIQIPVFMALYWVLLGSVELRHAPFMLWIHDLASKDPLYVLPVLMAISMYVQTKLNPKPTDPVQAKVMMIMPIVFSIFFFFFPAGLVLYWLVNNILSIAQQWQINRMIHNENLMKKKGHAVK